MTRNDLNTYNHKGFTMTNRSPIHKQHWSTVKDVKLYTREVLVYAADNKKDCITSLDVRDKFSIPLPEAGSRLLALYKRGYLSIKKLSIGGRGKVKEYYVNDNGLRRRNEMK